MKGFKTHTQLFVVGFLPFLKGAEILVLIPFTVVITVCRCRGLLILRKQSSLHSKSSFRNVSQRLENLLVELGGESQSGVTGSVNLKMMKKRRKSLYNSKI